MYSSLKSKFQTAVVMFLTLSMVSNVSLGQNAAAGTSSNQPLPGYPQIMSTEDRREERTEQQRVNNENKCEQLETEIKESYKQCSFECEEAVKECANGGESMSYDGDSTRGLVMGLGSAILGASINTATTKANPCNTGASDLSSKKDAVDREIKDADKELREFGKKEIEAAEKFSEEDEKLEEKQAAIKEKLDELEETMKENERTEFKKLADDQFKVNRNIREVTSKLARMRNELTSMVQQRKLMLIGYDMNSIDRLCRGQIRQAQVEECKGAKDQNECLNKRGLVMGSLSSAFTAGKVANADRVAVYNSCIKTTTIKYSGEIKKQTDDLSTRQLDIQQMESDLADMQKQQKQNEEFMLNQLNEMKIAKNKKAQLLQQKFFEMDKRRIERQGIHQQKIADIGRQRMILTMRGNTLSSSSTILSGQIPGADKSLSGGQLSEVAGNRNANLFRAVEMGCCELPRFSGGSLCTTDNRKAPPKKKPQRKTAPPATTPAGTTK